MNKAENMQHFFSSLPVDLIHKAETVSTNTDAREAIEVGFTRPLVIVADRQTGGRGRQGKVFLSPSGGLYMTLALPCGLPLSETIGVTSCAAVGVARAIESVSGAHCGIKWVNDLYLQGKKLCGILVESVNNYEKMVSETLLIGIGVNMLHTPLVTDSSVQAISLADAGYPCSRAALCAAIVREILDIREKQYDFSTYIHEYRERSIVLGREVSFTRNDRTQTGTVAAITQSGSLVVDCDGHAVTLDSGEIHLRVK